MHERGLKHVAVLTILRSGDEMLLLRRTKADALQGKYVPIGGHVDPYEAPRQAAIREVREETGLTPLNWKCRGVVSFISDRWEQEEMFVFTAGEYTGELTGCAEGELEWIEKTSVLNLDLWQGDRIFLELIFNDAPFFLLTLKYNGDSLVGASLNGTDIQTAV